MKAIPNTVSKFLWHFAKKHFRYLLGFIAIAIFLAVKRSLQPYALKLIIDDVSNSQTAEHFFSDVIGPSLLYVGIGFAGGIAFRIHDWLSMKTFPKMRANIIEDMFDFVIGHSYSYFQNNFTGSLSNKIKDMSKSAITIISTSIDTFFSGGLSLITGSITLFLIHPSFALLLMVWSIIFIAISCILSQKTQKYSEIFSESRSTLVGKIVDSLGNILNIKLFARERYETRYLHRFLEDCIAKEHTSMRYLLKIKLFYTFSIACLSLGMIALLLLERSKNNITIGDFALVLTLNMSLIDEIFYFVKQLVPFSEELGICQQALSIISLKHEILDTPEAKPLIVSRGDITFDKVSFEYKKGEKVFKDISIQIRSGERVGLVGFSGSGKSTFVNLILRFFDVKSGKILIDGQDITTVTQESLRTQIAMIPQDPTLFHRSLIENIDYGSLSIDRDEIITSAKKAHCHEFIEKLQGGYESLVGERGIKLSGGQRQRVAIARALLKDAPILILDEATSALDSVTEKYIQDSLSFLMKDRTTMVIAHRLSTLFHMDRILVFHEGRIIEEGTHSQLLDLHGHYAKLWNMQVGGFIEESENEE